MYLPLDTTTKWFMRMWRDCKASILILAGRRPTSHSRYPAMLAVFDGCQRLTIAEYNDKTAIEQFILDGIKCRRR